ncbi:MAG: hypothetical protein LQ352_004158 [Teloschistes flavicans]|nr:MAG: hypothetical protein LQ352_004158 [Teloschistes flavicans]
MEEIDDTLENFMVNRATEIARTARARGFRRYEDFENSLLRRMEVADELARVRHPSDHTSTRKAPYDPEKWFCQGSMVFSRVEARKTNRGSEHLDGADFCPGNLRTEPNSVTGGRPFVPPFHSLEGMVIDEQQPSKRLDDINLDRWWSCDTRAGRYKQPVAEWAKRDRIYQFLAALPDVSQAEEQAGVGPGHHYYRAGTAEQVELDEDTRPGPSWQRSQEKGKRKRADEESLVLQGTKRTRMGQSPSYSPQDNLDAGYQSGYESSDAQPTPYEDISQDSQDARARETRKRQRDDDEAVPDQGNKRVRSDQYWPSETQSAPAMVDLVRRGKPRTALDRSIEEEIQSLQDDAVEGQRLPDNHIARDPKDTRKERSGRGSTDSQRSPRESANTSPRGVTQAPTMKHTTRKRPVDKAIPFWQREALKEPRNTRSKKKDTFFALDQKGKIEAVVSRILKQATTQTRSQQQEEHFELDTKSQPVVAPRQRMKDAVRGANMRDESRKKASQSRRIPRSVQR